MKSSKSSSSRRTTSNHKENSGSNNSGFVAKNQICDICAQNVPGPEREKIFAFGRCDHYVCYVCSARLRVICDQSDCPICREKLDCVVFTSSRNQPFEKFCLKDCLYNEKYKIYFENKAIKNSFNKLLVYDCLECRKQAKSVTTKTKITTNRLNKDDLPKPSSAQMPCSTGKEKTTKHGAKETSSNLQEGGNTSTPANCSSHRNEKAPREGSPGVFERIEEDGQGLICPSDVVSKDFSDVFGLKNHLNYVHRLKLCDLCLTHNKLFPFEYSYYDSLTLKKHMKEGEPNTSHRGHPNCDLCHHTFFNTDELIQHMSREHFHCHLCGRHDSNMRIYFLDYDSLRMHFKAKHILCERDNCRHEQFTSAFDNKIDYEMHMLQVHGKSTAGLSRGEARQQRTITLDSAPHRARATSPTLSIRRNLPPNAAVVSTGSVATANSARQQQRPESIQIQIRQQRLPSRAEFPALGQAPNSSTSLNSQTTPNSSINHYPSLAQTNAIQLTSSSTLSQRMTAGPSNIRGSFVRTVGGGCRNPEQLNESDFPPLPEQPKIKSNKKSKPSGNPRPDNSSGLTLDQLISNSLTLSSRNTKVNGKKTGSKGCSAKSSKNVKQKLIKIQLS